MIQMEWDRRLKGITLKLDYLKFLGIDIIWLSPHF